MKSLVYLCILTSLLVGCAGDAPQPEPEASAAMKAVQADLERDRQRRDLKAKKKLDAEAEIERAKTAELKRLAWEAEAPKPAELEREAAVWKKSCCEYLHELLSFKDKDDFKFYGFGTAGPYTNWNKSILALHQSDFFNSRIHKYDPELSNAAFAIWRLGFKLLSGEQNRQWRSQLAGVKKAIDYDEYLRNLKK